MIEKMMRSEAWKMFAIPKAIQTVISMRIQRDEDQYG